MSKLTSTLKLLTFFLFFCSVTQVVSSYQTTWSHFFGRWPWWCRTMHWLLKSCSFLRDSRLPSLSPPRSSISISWPASSSHNRSDWRHCVEIKFRDFPMVDFTRVWYFSWQEGKNLGTSPGEVMDILYAQSHRHGWTYQGLWLPSRGELGGKPKCSAPRVIERTAHWLTVERATNWAIPALPILQGFHISIGGWG